MNPAGVSRGRGSRLYVTAVAAAGAGTLAYSVYRLCTAPPPLGWFVLAALTIVVSLAMLRMPQVAISFSIADTFTIAAALLFGPEAAAVLVTVDGLTMSARLSGLTPRRFVFNATAPMLAMWVAAHAFFRLAGMPPLAANPAAIRDALAPLAAFAGLYFLLNTGLIAGAIALEERRPIVAVWRTHFLHLWLTFFGGAAIAAVVALLLGSRDVDLGAFTAVISLLGVLYLTLHSTVGRMREEVERLSTVNRMYHSLIDGAAYGILWASRDGDLLAVNPALVAMLGYESPEELQRQNLWRDIAADPADARRVTGETGPAAGIELWWRRRNGETLLVRTSVRLVSSSPDRAATVEMLVEDVTLRRALEEQARQAQKLDALGRLSRGIAHDFNNLLTIIVASASEIGEHLPAVDPAQDEIRQLMNAAETAAKLMRQLMTFGRQQPTVPTSLDLNEVVQGSSELLQRLAGGRVTLRLETSPGLPPVLADRSQIEQVLMNLVINAKDAMPRGGTVTVRTSVAAEPSAATGGDPGGVRLHVRDTGEGMSEDVKAHIFEPFFTTKAPGKGTGLGLATVYGIVRQTGGEISVESRLQEGTTFTIVLPPAEVRELTPA